MFYLLYGILLTTSHAYPVAIPEAVKGPHPTWLGAGDWASLACCLLVVVVFHIVLTARAGVCTPSRSAATCTGQPRAGIRVKPRQDRQLHARERVGRLRPA